MQIPLCKTHAVNFSLRDQCFGKLWTHQNRISNGNFCRCWTSHLSSGEMMKAQERGICQKTWLQQYSEFLSMNLESFLLDVTLPLRSEVITISWRQEEKTYEWNKQRELQVVNYMLWTCCNEILYKYTNSRARAVLTNKVASPEETAIYN